MAKRTKSERRTAASRSEAPGEEVITPTEATVQGEQVVVEGVRVTRELPAIELATTESAPVTEPMLETVEPRDEQPSGMEALDLGGMDDEFDEGATRESEAVLPPRIPLTSAEPDATVVRATPFPPAAPPAAIVNEAPDVLPAQATPAPRPRYNTLAGAFSRPRSTPPPSDPVSQSPLNPPLAEEFSSIADEVDPETEWSLADQPTIHMTPEELGALKPSLRPSFLDTGDQPSWPPRQRLSRAHRRRHSPEARRSRPLAPMRKTRASGARGCRHVRSHPSRWIA